MSQQQPRRAGGDQPEPIKYGDIFPVQGELAYRTVTPQDAAAVQAAETVFLGKTQKGGAAALIQSAAAKNEMAGLVSHDGDTENVVADDIRITQTEMPGKRVITESVGGQVVTQNSERVPIAPMSTMDPQKEGGGGGGITIGEALEATALAAGQKPVEWSDAAAIQAAEVRATGQMNIAPGGVAATAQSAATMNARITRDEDKTKLADVLKDVRSKLPTDRPATRRDAEGVAGAEMRNNPFLTTHPTGVAASIAAAARLNENENENDKKDQN